jgi:hypothetical protein
MAAPALPNSCTSARWRKVAEAPGCVGLTTTVHVLLPASREAWDVSTPGSSLHCLLLSAQLSKQSKAEQSRGPRTGLENLPPRRASVPGTRGDRRIRGCPQEKPSPEHCRTARGGGQRRRVFDARGAAWPRAPGGYGCSATAETVCMTAPESDGATGPNMARLEKMPPAATVWLGAGQRDEPSGSAIGQDEWLIAKRTLTGANAVHLITRLSPTALLFPASQRFAMRCWLSRSQGGCQKEYRRGRR